MTPAGQRNAGAASNQYQILGHLATGGMAELYLARAVGIAGFERYVVLKRIMAEHARNHRFVTMFLDEARLAAQLHHPNIAQVYDIGRVSDSYFFTMEYVHGENVRDVLQRVAALKRQIPVEVTLSIIAGAAAGLQYAHDKRGINRQPLGIVHRDVSPSNLMVSYEGAVKLVDFGIAKAAHRMTETRSGAVKGKVAYMSPEQCTGHPLDRRSDVFSLGIVLFEMSTMTRLFKHPTDFETMTHIVNNPVPVPSSRRPELARELDQIILKALAKKPEDRFQTAGELHEAIEAFAARDRLALSNLGLARYVRELFGERPEPWYELEVADNTGLVTVETAAVPEGLEPDPFGPNSTQRSWSGAGKTAPREWAGAPVSDSRAAFGENASPTTPARPPPPGRGPGDRPLDGPADPPAGADADGEDPAEGIQTVRAEMPDMSVHGAIAAAKPKPLPPTRPLAKPAAKPTPASLPTLIAPAGAPLGGDAPRKPSTNPAASPPPPMRISAAQPAVAPPPSSPSIAPPPSSPSIALPSPRSSSPAIAVPTAAAPVVPPTMSARSTIAGLPPPPAAPPTVSAVHAVPAASAVMATPAIEPEDSAGSDGGAYTQVSTPRTAPLVIQNPDLIRDTPDHDPSWAGERDPSWRGQASTEYLLPQRSSRRWMLWSALAVAAAGVVVLLVLGRGDPPARAARGADEAGEPAKKVVPGVEARGAATGSADRAGDGVGGAGPDDDVGAGAGSGSDPGTGAGSVTGAGAGSGSVTGPVTGTGSVTGTGAGSGTGSDSVTGTGAGSGTGSDPGTGSGSGAGSDPGAGSGSGAGSDPGAGSGSDAGSASRALDAPSTDDGAARKAVTGGTSGRTKRPTNTKRVGATTTPTATGKVTPTATGKVTPTTTGKVTPTTTGKVTPTTTGKVTPTTTGKVTPTTTGKVTPTTTGKVTPPPLKKLPQPKKCGWGPYPPCD